MKKTVAALSFVGSNGSVYTINTSGTKAAPGSKLVSWVIEWGDGSIDSGNIIPSSTNFSTNRAHSYSIPGTYKIRLTVKDSKNRIGFTEMGMIVRVPVVTPPSGGGQVGLISGTMVDDFEDPSGLRSDTATVNPILRHDEYPNTGVATEFQSTANPYQGTRHWRGNVTSVGSNYGLYAQYLLYANGGASVVQLHNSRTALDAWIYDYYNRLRSWVRVNTNYVAPGTDTQGFESFNIGTYIRSSDNDWAALNEVGPGANHWYNFYRLTGTGTWWQVVIDSHPTATRAGGYPGPGGSPGWDTISDLWEPQNYGLYGTEYPTFEAGQNHMDRLSNLYWAFSSNFSPGATGNHDIDAIEFYRDPYDVIGNRLANIKNVHTTASNYRASDNLLSLSWNRWMGDDVTPHDVRIAFSDIYELGWDNATPLMTVNPTLGSGPFNVMWLENNTINMGANDFIYIAIKPQGDALFNQIVHPVTGPATV